MCELETKVPQSHSPSPSHAAPRFQLQPSTPEISTHYASNPNLLKRMQESIYFKCHQKGHWFRFCPLNNNNNLSPVPTKQIQCCCGHGLCDFKIAQNNRNRGKKYFVCPIKRGERCKYFVRWCDDPIKKSDLQPPLFKYPECECGAGVCRKVWSPNVFKYYFECPIKQGHGSCGYRVWEDEVRNNTSIVPMPEDVPLNNTCIVPMMEDELLNNTSIVPKRSLHEFWEEQNDTTDNDLGEGAGGDLSVKTKRMRIIDNSESPSPMALSVIPEENDGGSLIKSAINSQHVCFPRFEIEEDDPEFTHLVLEVVEAIEAKACPLSRLSTPSKIRWRQSLFDSDIAGAGASFGGLASKVLKNKMQQLNAARKDFQGLSDRIISPSHGSRWKTPENGLPSSVPSTDRVHGLSLCPSKLLKIDRLGGIRHRLHDPKSRHQRLPEFEDHWDNPEDSLWNNGFDCTNLLEDVIMKDVDESQLTAPSHLGLCQDLAAHGLRMVAMARFVDASVS